MQYCGILQTIKSQRITTNKKNWVCTFKCNSLQIKLLNFTRSSPQIYWTPESLKMSKGLCMQPCLCNLKIIKQDSNLLNEIRSYWHCNISTMCLYFKHKKGNANLKEYYRNQLFLFSHKDSEKHLFVLPDVGVNKRVKSKLIFHGKNRLSSYCFYGDLI